MSENRVSLADKVNPNLPTEGLVRCSECDSRQPLWALYWPLDDEPFVAQVCGACINAHARQNAPQPPKNDDPWSTDKGQHLKAERDMALNGSRWAIMPDSPLTAECQAAHLAYMQLLHRMTVDHLPEAWEWPAKPELEYA
ncbi:phage tail assembly chaperone [Sphingomonas melonis]|uniref:phage tail assembly chaperone n=1 Tax=Sphingomonas melonis TaxID=152682 RepID=UPI0035C85F17